VDGVVVRSAREFRQDSVRSKEREDTERNRSRGVDSEELIQSRSKLVHASAFLVSEAAAGDRCSIYWLRTIK